ncbi:hypothetical protein AERO9A_210063 [Aeromonas salmonicida]|nr:hypothetical protein AERO9A_210063 [Aeromonas salmonicida]
MLLFLSQVNLHIHALTRQNGRKNTPKKCTNKPLMDHFKHKYFCRRTFHKNDLKQIRISIHYEWLAYCFSKVTFRCAV